MEEITPKKYSARNRYRNNPKYRAYALEYSRRRHLRFKGNRTYDNLIRVGKKIVRRRDTIERYLNRIKKLERDLFRLVKLKDELREKFKRERAEGKIKERKIS